VAHLGLRINNWQIVSNHKYTKQLSGFGPLELVFTSSFIPLARTCSHSVAAILRTHLPLHGNNTFA